MEVSLVIYNLDECDLKEFYSVMLKGEISVPKAYDWYYLFVSNTELGNFYSFARYDAENKETIFVKEVPSGDRTNRLHKGINIVNGKKVFVK